MAELEVPKAGEPTTVPSTTEHGTGATIPLSSGVSTSSERGTTVNGHGRGYDGINGTTTQAQNGDAGRPRQVTIAVVGAGQRGQVYASYAVEHPDLAKIIAVAEPRPHRRKVLSRAHDIPPDQQFASWKDMHARGRIADAVVIAVLDDLHAELVEAFAQQGYDILCEKPMATRVDHCVKMVKDVTANNNIFGMGHVLRYSPYNVAIKKVIDSGALGEIINIQHIEPVGNVHFSHSFVRGNWHKEADTSFSLMTKCCHDLDILSFYFDGLKPKKVHSFGSIGLFKPSKKPKEAGNAKRCYDCAYEPKCVWSAKRIYVDALQDGGAEWARHVVDADVLDIENVSEALKGDSQYGRCVYECGNDVVDHQVVNIEYETGATASMTMSAFTQAECDRATHIHGTKGELIGDMNGSTFTVFDFETREKKITQVSAEGSGHGGGDVGLSRAFVQAVANQDQKALGVTPDDVLNSHLLVFAAEKARRRSAVVDFDDFKQGALKGAEVFP